MLTKILPAKRKAWLHPSHKAKEAFRTPNASRKLKVFDREADLDALWKFKGFDRDVFWNASCKEKEQTRSQRIRTISQIQMQVKIPDLVG